MKVQDSEKFAERLAKAGKNSGEVLTNETEEREEEEMKTRTIIEEPLYSYYTNCEDIKLYRKDFDTVEVGDTFKAEAWDRDTNATERTYITVTCIYRDQNGVLLREHAETIYYDNAYDNEESLELVWVELKGGRK